MRHGHVYKRVYPRHIYGTNGLQVYIRHCSRQPAVRTHARTHAHARTRTHARTHARVHVCMCNAHLCVRQVCARMWHRNGRWFWRRYWSSCCHSSLFVSATKSSSHRGTWGMAVAVGNQSFGDLFSIEFGSIVTRIQNEHASRTHACTAGHNRRRI